MNDATNDDSTPLGFPPLTLPAPRVYGLLGGPHDASAPPSPRPTAFDLWMAANLQKAVAGVLAKAPVPELLQADADAFWRLVFQPPADDVVGDPAKPLTALDAPPPGTRSKGGNPGHLLRPAALIEIALRRDEGWDDDRILLHIRTTWAPMANYTGKKPDRDTTADWVRPRKK